VKQIFSAAEQLFVGQRSMKPKAMEGEELLREVLNMVILGAFFFWCG
jgi:hypothetical protein